MNQKTLDKITTEADRLYCMLDDGDTVSDEEVHNFLDELINMLESVGGRVDGISYIK